jgi:nitrite reductase/ring-hydroxylating ferredoxin subunit
VKTGQSIAYPKRSLPTYPVRVQDGMLTVEL